MRLIYFVLTLSVISGCSSVPPGYDPNALEVSARIIEKKLVGSFTQDTAEVNSSRIIPFGKYLVFVQFRNDVAVIPLYEYTVSEKDKKITKVISDASVFEPGYCVILFTSDQPTYPRIAFGGKCNEF